MASGSVDPPRKLKYSIRRIWVKETWGGKAGIITITARIVLRDSVIRFESLAPGACTLRGRTGQVPAVGERLLVGELFQVAKGPSIGFRTIFFAQELVLFMYLNNICRKDL
jgi:hypothetical protein